MTRTVFSFAAIAAGVAAAPVCARPISTFDAGPDGWTLPASTEWRSTGGNGGGYLHGSVAEPGNVTSGAFAPAAFLGDWSGYDGTGTLSYDFRRFDNGADPLSFFPLLVVIQGPGGTATWSGSPIVNQPTDWFNVTVPIDAMAWSIDDGTWEAILANVTTLYIQIELVTNGGPPDDQAGIDNVSLVPTPGAAALGALGLAGLARRRRR